MDRKAQKEHEMKEDCWTSNILKAENSLINLLSYKHIKHNLHEEKDDILGWVEMGAQGTQGNSQVLKHNIVYSI